MVVFVEKCEDSFEEEDEEDGGDGGVLHRFPLPLPLSSFPLPPPEEPSPLGGLELSPCSLLFLSS